ncbi:MAG: type VI secretion system baseplate subunit TssF [Verrucomicrobia bacterium]|nr:type VI secretion system baseplate subunit TssF [Verrucomicrobiota bacterium]
MLIDDKIYQAYLEELQHIEKFRASHIALYGDTPLDSEDPNTKRLIEAMAFFGARARLHGVRQITQIHERLFRQYFPYLVNPLPAFGMLQITPSIRYPERVTLAAGSELIFKTSNQLKATFQTLDAVDIFPLFLKNFQFEKHEGFGWRCIIEYSSLHVSTEELGSMKFYINHLNSFFSSLRVLFAIQHSLIKARVFYDTPEIHSAEGFECPLSFGSNTQERSIFFHEIEQIRSLLHLPQQELFLNFSVPPCGKRWKTVTFCLDFNEKWPDSIKLNADSFLPFIVPIANFRKAHADPIISDGTKDSFPILHPEPIYQFELHTVLNVSKVLTNGTKPLKPGILGKVGDSYEVDYFNKNLLLDLPEAFHDPATVIIEALWTQPWFSDYMNVELDLQFNAAQAFGLGTRLLGSLHRHEQSIEDDPEFLIRLLSLKNQSYLNLNEILFIVNAMKKLSGSFFDAIPDWILDLKTRQRMDQKNFSSVIEYEFFLKDWNGQRWEAVVLFFKYINRMLSSWLPHFEIETIVHFPQIKKPLILKQGKDYELSALAGHFFLSQ